MKRITPIIDSGWGLIYRLNDLWREVERVAPQGKYSEWNFKLDRIWCNLLYRNPMEIKRNDGKIIKMKFSAEDIEEKDFIDNQVLEAMGRMKEAITNEDKNEYSKAKRKCYEALLVKDVWLKKFMHQLNLYLKEIEYDPSKAIYGGYSK